MLILAMAGALVTAGCGAGDGSSTGVPFVADEELECEAEGYPCALTDVPDEILDRSDALADDALAMFATGSSTADVEAWLTGQEGIVEVESEDLVLRFRLEGGRGTWVVRRGAFGTRGTIGGGATGGGGSAAPKSLAAGLPSTLLHVAGGDSENKQAIVLSPFQWDFAETDDGQAVANILRDTRGYEGGVTFDANATRDEVTVNVNDFKGWGAFDVVHVVSHGFRLCKSAPCRAVISSGLLHGPAPVGEGILVKKAFLPGDRGVELAKVEGCERGLVLKKNDDPDPDCPEEVVAVDIVLLSADFFRATYGGGLQDTFVFFNACETFGAEATDLADTLRGSSSVFLGWDEKVDTGAAFDAAVALYEELSKIGSEVDVAYQRLGGLRQDGTGANLELGKRRDNDGLRIRDVVFLLDPDSGSVLSPADNVAILGGLDDDEEDTAPYAVRVDGIPAEVATDAKLHVTIDGVESEPQTVADGTPGTQKDQWTVSGEVELGFDLKEEKPAHFRAWVELPENGESDHETGATLGGPEPIMGYTWVLEARWSRTPTQPDGPSVPETATARLTLEFDKSQAFDEPKPRYTVTGGTVSWDPSFTDRWCRVKGDSVTFETGAVSAPWVELVFDTTVSPVRWSGFIETTGPDVATTWECLAGTGEDADPEYKDPIDRTRPAEFIWLIVDEAESRTVTGNSISGTWLLVGKSQPSYDRQSNYTITRVK